MIARSRTSRGNDVIIVTVRNTFVYNIKLYDEYGLFTAFFFYLYLVLVHVVNISANQKYIEAACNIENSTAAPIDCSQTIIMHDIFVTHTAVFLVFVRSFCFYDFSRSTDDNVMLFRGILKCEQ